MKKEKIQIDPNKMYSLTEICKMQVVPGIKSYPTLRNKVLEDKILPVSKRVINAIEAGEGRAKKYFIIGGNLISFIEAVRSQAKK